jgi:hypothetical protein
MFLGAQDAQRWEGKNIEIGLKQVVFEFLPIRGDQLLGLYGPGGARPLLPEAQSNATAAVAAVKLESAAAGNATHSYLQVGRCVCRAAPACSISCSLVCRGGPGPRDWSVHHGSLTAFLLASRWPAETTLRSMSAAGR